jgi:hypothetical protein
MVAHRNVTHFVDAMVVALSGITEHDRFSQTFDLTFDLSAFDMFVCLGARRLPVLRRRRARRCCPASTSTICRLTSVVLGAVHRGADEPAATSSSPGKYPGPALEPVLRRGAAGGSDPARLPKRRRTRCARTSTAPTELTIACTLYRWDTQRSRPPIIASSAWCRSASPIPGMKVLVADEQQREVAESARPANC